MPVLRGAGGAAWLALSSWLCPAQVQAQFPDLVDLSAQYLPGVPLEDPRPLEVQVASYEGTLNLPIVLGKNTFLIPGVGYHNDAVSYAHLPPGFTELRAFHSIDVPLLFVQLLPNDWSMSVRLAPGLAADSPGLEAEQLRLSALMLFTRSFSERLVLGAGGLASYSFGTLLPLPALYAEWKPIDGWRIESFLPAFVDSRYTFWDRLELGLRADIAGNSYAVRDERIHNAWPCAGDGALGADRAQCFDHVAVSTGVVGLVTGVRLFGSVWWTAMGGYTVYRRFDQRNARDERVSGGLQAMPDAPFVRTNLTWRIPRD